MKQERVDLWSAASFAAARAAITADHLPSGTAHDVAPRLAARLTGAAADGAAAAAVEILATAEGRLAGPGPRRARRRGAAARSGAPRRTEHDRRRRPPAGRDRGLQHLGGDAAGGGAGPPRRRRPDPDHRPRRRTRCARGGQAAGVRAVGAVPAAGRCRHHAGRRRRVLAAGRRPHRHRARAVRGAAWTSADRAEPKVAAGRPSSHVAMLTRLALTGVWDEVRGPPVGDRRRRRRMDPLRARGGRHQLHADGRQPTRRSPPR